MYKLFAIIFLFTSPKLAISSDWTYEKKVDEFDDSEIHIASQVLENEATAVVRCSSGKLEIYFTFGEYIGNEASLVRFRTDKKEAVDAGEWATDSSGVAVFSDRSIRRLLLNQMLSGASLLVQAVDFRGVRHMSKFNLKDASSTVKKVVNACNFRLEDAEYSGIDPELMGYLNSQGPLYIACQKEMLTSLGYKFEDINSDMTLDYAQTYQDFAESQIHRNMATSYALYTSALEKNPTFRETCGQIATGD